MARISILKHPNLTTMGMEAGNVPSAPALNASMYSKRLVINYGEGGGLQNQGRIQDFGKRGGG